MSFHVRRAQPSDKHKVLDFYKKYHPERKRLLNLDIWVWRYQKNSEPDHLPFFIIEDEGEIQGTIGYVPREIQVFGEAVDACHPMDFFINPQYKGLPALTLFRRIIREKNIIFGAYLSDDARRLFKKIGFIDFSGFLQHSYLPLKIENTSIGIRKAKTILLYSVRRLLYFSLNLYCHIGFGFHSPKYQISENISPDEIPHNVITLRDIGFSKGFDYLKWRYVDSPSIHCTFIKQFKESTVNCCIVLHKIDDENRVVIMDMLYSSHVTDKHIIHALLKAVEYCTLNKIGIMSVEIMNSRVTQMLNLFGFSRAKSTLGLMFYSKNKKLKSDLNHPTALKFYLGDTDIY